MANSSTMTVYLGSGEEGIRNERLIRETAQRCGMKRSEYVLFCVLKHLESEAEQAKKR